MLNTDDIDEVVEALGEYTDVLLEGGPRLAGAFLAAGYVDRIEAYIAPILLGAGASALVGCRSAHHHRRPPIPFGVRR